MGTGATRQRLWNLSPLGGAQGDVMNVMKWHWCDQAEIIESMAARGCLRGCYECYELALVQPGRDYEIYRRSGAPEGMI